MVFACTWTVAWTSCTVGHVVAFCVVVVRYVVGSLFVILEHFCMYTWVQYSWVHCICCSVIIPDRVFIFCSIWFLVQVHISFYLFGGWYEHLWPCLLLLPLHFHWMVCYILLYSCCIVVISFIMCYISFVHCCCTFVIYLLLYCYYIIFFFFCSSYIFAVHVLFVHLLLFCVILYVQYICIYVHLDVQACGYLLHLPVHFCWSSRSLYSAGEYSWTYMSIFWIVGQFHICRCQSSCCQLNWNMYMNMKGQTLFAYTLHPFWSVHAAWWSGCTVEQMNGTIASCCTCQVPDWLFILHLAEFGRSLNGGHEFWHLRCCGRVLGRSSNGTSLFASQLKIKERT